MNILYLTHRIPYPPNKGDKIRTYNTLRYLAERHDVWCACFVDDPSDMQYVSDLRAMCREVIAIPLPRLQAKARALLALFVDESASEGFYQNHEMATRLRELSRSVRFDAALFFSSSMGQYADCVRARRLVLDFCDLDSRKWADLAKRSNPLRSWVYRAEARMLAARERELFDRFDASILISDTEAADWNVRNRDKLHIIGNGVALPELPRDRRYDSNIVGFVGDLRYPPNEDAVRWFAGEVWPRVRDANSSAQFHIVGRGPSRGVRRLDGQNGIRVIGEVPEVLPHWLSFQVAVAPLRIARGIQNKVLEAMAAALPVVATPQASAGIWARDGWHLEITGDSMEMAQRIQQLLNEPRACKHIGTAARRHMELNYGWSRQLEPLGATLCENSIGVATGRALMEPPPVAVQV
ncbi:MAG: TIGR03087 family PEP-CTERM/XrtA system glycosyltransferase [Phycisphaerales bacterium]|nr:TIGR03087 family PEP-CTERM/XrtA system glycosyltransferase [Phycisphaerales bacterium]